MLFSNVHIASSIIYASSCRPILPIILQWLHTVYLFPFWLTFGTFKKNCPVEIRLCAPLDGQHLEVKSVNFNHNYDVGKVSVYTILYQAMNVYEYI